MLRSAFILGIVAVHGAPRTGPERLAARLDRIRRARSVQILHEQDPPGIERFVGYSVRQVIAIANRRRTITDPAVIGELLEAIDASQPTPSPNDFDCFWVAQFFDSNGRILETIALNGWGSQGVIGESEVIFAHTNLVRELSKLVPDRPITDAERHQRIRLPCGRPGEHS